ncbi:MAG: ABC transporter ATP-binding protein [Myxococcota bacterium]
MSGAPVLRAEGVIARPGGRSGFELSFDRLELLGGETLAVLGPNGSGKSTLLRVLAGIEPGLRGRVERLAGAGAALVFQRPVLLAGSVEHNVRVALWGSGLPRAERAARVERELERFGIAALARRPATTLSGGEARRLALARAFAKRPEVLLLDEPFDDLDAEAQEALSLDLEQVVAETAVAVAVVTHDLERALLLADRLAVLIGGRLRQIGPRDQVLCRPADPDVAGLVGMTNLVEGVVEAQLGDGSLRVRVDADHAVVAHASREPAARVRLGIRPEHLKVDVGRGEGVSIGKGVVAQVRTRGRLVAVSVDWAGTRLRTHLLAGRGLGHSLRVGDAVSLRVRPSDVHLL